MKRRHDGTGTTLQAKTDSHASIDGDPVWVPNRRFTWRYFGADQAREPFPFVIPRSKSSDAVRVFVFGESAAFGDPQPEFGLARMLEALLSLRYPDVRFEVVNAAMTAINSHVIVPIARDCVRATKMPCGFDATPFSMRRSGGYPTGPAAVASLTSMRLAHWPNGAPMDCRAANSSTIMST